LKPSAISGFYKLSLSTLIAVFVLILVGGIVRSTGSGMGCPDWPKCFGQWVPPTSIDQLPTDYKESYADYRAKKNQKFARYLNTMGMEETASQILNDPAVQTETDFNAVKTWIEYINRVIGVVIGLFIIALFLRSIKFRKSYPVLFWVSGATLLAVIVQGWFGSIVVSTNLTTWTISVHMFVALLIVALLVFVFTYTQRLQGSARTGVDRKVMMVMLTSMLVLLIQVFLGTQVREAIDQVASKGVLRNNWISSIWADFVIHRSFSWVVLLIHASLVIFLLKTSFSRPLIQALIVLLLCNVISGMLMAYGAVPAFIQPVHLLVATLTFGLQVHLFLRLNTKVVPALGN
jgi:heme a synthase